ncbi:MAG: hypothetical protein NVSMB19_15840 [Vulcanimicrobiaceae bacterium]
MAKSTFGILLAIAGLVLVWSIVTGRLARLASGDIVLSHGAGAAGAGAGGGSPPPAPVDRPAETPSRGSSGEASRVLALTNSGAFLPLGPVNFGLPVGGAHLGLDAQKGISYG